MPDDSHPKAYEHPWKSTQRGMAGSRGIQRQPFSLATGDTASTDPAICDRPLNENSLSSSPLSLSPSVPQSLSPYAELQVTSNYTFLTGGSHPDELVRTAAALGHRAACITDRNSLAGIVRAHVAAKEVEVPLMIGCRVEIGRTGTKGPRDQGTEGVGPYPFPLVPQSLGPLAPPLSLLTFPATRAAYGRLCQLLTLGKRRAPKGECYLTLHDLLAHHEGLLVAVIPPAILDEHFIDTLLGLKRVFNGSGSVRDDRVSIAASRLYTEDDDRRLAQLAALSCHVDLPLVATNDVHYHVADRRALQDVLTCIRHSCTLDEAGFLLHANAERHLKPASEMARLFADYPQAITRTTEIAERVTQFSLDEIQYQYPDEVCPDNMTPMAYLKQLTWEGAAERFSTFSGRSKIAVQGDELSHNDNDENENMAICDRPLNENDSLLADNSTTHTTRDDTSRLATSPYSPLPLSPSVPQSLPPSIRQQIEHEFELIEDLNYAPYFLTVYDLVEFAKSQGIICQGRGAAANSAVCYCLGITAVDPTRVDLLFERFISRERNEPPDIDIDFEHERREEVIQYIYKKYGRHRAALTAEVISYRGRSAVREVGKALGLSLDCVDRLAKNLDWWEHGDIHHDRIAELGLNPHDPTMQRMGELIQQIIGFPRHLSQHVGGFVITQGPLCELVPIENAAMDERTIIEWDKDDIDAMGMLKVDCLGLGMLTCIGKCFGLIEAARGLALSGKPLALHTIPPEDPLVYDMICNADTVGVFQIESRAQMQMLPRLRPRNYYDLVIEVAIVRPGPIQGDMVHPYLRRRNGEEPVTYPNDAVEKVLGKTLGVPLFQEQAMLLAIVAGGFTPGEADRLRRAIAAWKSKQKIIFTFGEKLINGMIANGYEREFAERCFNQIKGFSEYGFPESHAASFALIVYVSAWLKCHHPAAFAAALINSQPMGFYAPAQIVRDAQEHDVEVRGVDVNCSAWDCSLEGTEGSRDQGTKGTEESENNNQCDDSTLSVPQSLSPLAPSPPLRLGMRLIKGMRKPEANAIADAAQAHGPFHSIDALWRASGVRVAALRTLASADAFRSMGLDRQQALWQVRALRDEVLPLFEQTTGEAFSGRSQIAGTEREHATPCNEPPGTAICDHSLNGISLPEVSLPRQVVHDYATVGLSLKAHPISFIRDTLSAQRVIASTELMDESTWLNGKPVAVAGLVLVRQRPGTASGVVFVTLEDETGVANLIIRPRVFERYRKAARHATIMLARGHVERKGQVVHVMVQRVEDISQRVTELIATSRDFH